MRAGISDKDKDRNLAPLERVCAGLRSGLPLPRLLLVFAHPDDEVLAVGGRLERMSESHLITVTDGAPVNGADAREHGFEDLGAYRAARCRELEAALAHSKLSEDFLLPFAAQVADQEASLHLVDLACGLADHIAALRPEAVLTHPYEGGHPDHDACAFAVHAGVRLLAERGAATLPVILEAPFYCAGDNGALRTGTFLKACNETFARRMELTAEEAANKRFRLECFRSQRETLAQFGTESESFRVAPNYDFTEPPHTGQLWYERFSWGMNGEHFRQLAKAALLQVFPLDAEFAVAESTPGAVPA